MNDKVTFDFSALRGRIVQYYGTIEKFADAIPMGRVTLYLKLRNKRDFTSENIYRIAKLLNIASEEINIYFFTEKV
jgi:hypothetical protein